jgi:two-component system sensor histidine kinase BaeS
LVEVGKAVHGIAQQKQISVVVEAPENLVVPLDPEQMSIVLANIASNAVRHSGTGATVWLNAEAQGDGVTFSIRDQGEGIRPEDLSRVFDRHWSGADPTTLKGRHGLGLAIAREIVERHGGDMNVESELGVGTTFRVHLSTPAADT